MPSPPRWMFLICNLDGSPVGEVVGAGSRTVTLPFNRVPTASFQVPLWHPIAPTLLTQDCLLKVYRRDTAGTSKLVFFGPVIGAEESATSDSQSIAVTATGPFWRLSKRLIGKTRAGYANGTEASPVDLGGIARNMIDVVNGDGHTGITTAGATYQTSTNGFVSGWTLKNVAEGIAELAAGIGSFDWDVTPIEPDFTAPATPSIPSIGRFNVYNRPKGVIRPDAIFEYGTPRANVTEYRRAKTYDQILNRAYLALPGWPDGVTDDNLLSVNSDATSITNRGIYEELVNDAGVIDKGIRDKIGQEHLRYRANPRNIVTFKPSMNATPQPFTDYEIGDWVRARAVVRGTIRFDAMFRIWGATFNVDQNGNESLDLQLVQE